MDAMHLIRTGTVSAVKKGERTATVLFDGDGMVSAPLKILKSPPLIPAADVPQVTEMEGGGSGEATFASHNHKLVITPWLPKVGERVLCLCLPGNAGDGFVLGGL